MLFYLLFVRAKKKASIGYKYEGSSVMSDESDKSDDDSDLSDIDISVNVNELNDEQKTSLDSLATTFGIAQKYYCRYVYLYEARPTPPPSLSLSLSLSSVYIYIYMGRLVYSTHGDYFLQIINVKFEERAAVLFCTVKSFF